MGIKQNNTALVNLSKIRSPEQQNKNNKFNDFTSNRKKRLENLNQRLHTENDAYASKSHEMRIRNIVPPKFNKTNATETSPIIIETAKTESRNL